MLSEVKVSSEKFVEFCFSIFFEVCIDENLLPPVSMRLDESPAEDQAETVAHSEFKQRPVRRWIRLRKHGKHKKPPLGSMWSVICFSSTWRRVVDSILSPLRAEFSQRNSQSCLTSKKLIRKLMTKNRIFLTGTSFAIIIIIIKTTLKNKLHPTKAPEFLKLTPEIRVRN